MSPSSCPPNSSCEGDVVWLHLVRANPVFAALAENPRVVMSVAADWAFVPSAWKAMGEEDPALGIPTTYYAAVQLTGTATIRRRAHRPRQRGRHPAPATASFQPGHGGGRPGPGARAEALGIVGISIAVEEVQAKFKYGGNVDAEHRLAVVDHLAQRNAPGDAGRRTTPCGA